MGVGITDLSFCLCLVWFSFAVQGFFAPEDLEFARVAKDSTNAALFRNLCDHGDVDPNVTFSLIGGTGPSRRCTWRAILVFMQHTSHTVMPAAIAYPGLADPGGNPLPVTFSSWFGLFHLLAALTQHAAGAAARGHGLSLEVTVQGHDMFSVELL